MEMFGKGTPLSTSTTPEVLSSTGGLDEMSK
jgi:hypothetical protein